jgi:NAD(P)H-quinone oxidoreductase subunit 4
MLSVLIWLPILGAAIVGFLPQSVPVQQIRNVALTVTGVVLLWTIWLFTQFDLANSAFQMREYLPWIETLGMNYELAMDGVALVMVGLNSLLTWIALLSSHSKTERPRLFYALILLISGGVAGAFLAQNLLLFFLFYDLGRREAGLCSD